MTTTLYGLNKDGSIKVWQTWTEGNQLVISHGKEGGKMTTKKTPCFAKNIGRANQTSPDEQAVLEMESRIKKQFDKGYRYKKEDLGDLPLKPMLAHDYTKGKNSEKITYPCYVSPKLDGVRCVARWENGKVVLLSRGGKYYEAPVKIIESLEQIMGDKDILDGELYLHGTMLQDITGASKKWREGLTDQLEYHVFDVIREGGYGERLSYLDNLLRGIPDGINNIKMVSSWLVTHESIMKEWHDQLKKLGYEGVMLRNTDGEYEQRRSYGLQKYKEFVDEEFEIIGVREDRNGNAVFDLQHPSGGTFGCSYGSFDERKVQLENPQDFIGKALTVKYQSLYKDTGLPQFPTGVMVREGEFLNGKFYPSE